MKARYGVSMRYHSLICLFHDFCIILVHGIEPCYAELLLENLSIYLDFLSIFDILIGAGNPTYLALEDKHTLILSY